MAGLFNIQSVGGSSPNWALTVDDSSSAITGDHVSCPLLAATSGGIFRVSSVPDGTTINVVDDLKPGGSTYGEPGPGVAQAYTPTSVKKLSQQVLNGPFWGDTVNRDLEIIDEIVPGDIKSGTVLKASFSGSPRTYAVVFSTAFPDDDYTVTFGVHTTSGVFNVVAQSKSASGFTINLGTSNDTSLVSVFWQAIPVGE